MALKQIYKKEVYGEVLEFEEAYHRISQLSATVDEINISVEIYKDSNKDVVLGINYHTFPENEIAGIDLIQMGYELLKSLEEYKGAINIFEEGQPERNY